MILVRGRIVGTWLYERKGKGLTVTLRPFEPLGRSVQKRVDAEARRLAVFFGATYRD